MDPKKKKSFDLAGLSVLFYTGLRLDRIKEDCWAPAEACAQLSAIRVLTEVFCLSLECGHYK